MISKKDIKKHCSEEQISYLERKIRGGINNQKGNAFEFKFSISKICELSSLYFRHTLNSKICSQATAFIDDLYIRVEKQTDGIFYQIKDIQQLTWNGGKNSLEEDCKLQIDLNEKLKLSDWRIEIILSDINLSQSLENTNPFKSLGKPVSVKHFPIYPNLDLYINEHHFRNGLSDLSAKVNPDQSDLNHVLTLIAGVWVKESRRCLTFVQFLGELKKSRHNLIRGNNYIVKRKSFIRILNSITGFSFDTSRGYFNWTYRNADSGSLVFSCSSPQFKKFVNNVIKLNPKNFEELESLL